MLIRKLCRYFLTGGVAAIVDVGAFVLLVQGTPVVVAAIASFTIAAVVNFCLTTRFVFDQAPAWKRFPSFFGTALVGLALNAAVTTWLTAHGSLLPAFCKVAGIGVAFFVNFLLNYLVVFRTES